MSDAKAAATWYPSVTCDRCGEDTTRVWVSADRTKLLCGNCSENEDLEE